ncbi:hypothetical protein [Haloferula sp.]|uniref:hypothetical protein n=1 Tax=Haloferula sp. TaxID=2497595 RepID=UPI00329BF675
MRRLLAPLAAFLLPSVHAEEEAKAPDFVRVTEAEEATRLQTAVVRFEKDGVSVELLGAVHIADADYYDVLDKRFEQYDALLFEGIGGSTPEPKPEAMEDLEVELVPREKESLDGLHKIYNTAAEWLELSYQMSEIDYTKANFVHADLSAAEFQRLQAQRDESIIRFILKLSFQAERPEREPSTYGIIKALINKDADGLKYELVHTLASADELIASIEGDNVIITDRNTKCLEVLDEQIALGRKKLGIFYGAAHFPDMEERLIEDGWTKVGEEWLTAWDIEG